MNASKSIFTILLLVGALLPARAAAQYYVPVQGQVFSGGGPVPGVTVFLVHPILGRSAPSQTDIYGRFGWSAIPLRQEPYYVEIYWGQQIVYRQMVGVGAPYTQLPPIML